LPLFLLSALLLADNGLRIAMHGAGGHTAGRLYTADALAAFGIAAAASLADAATQLSARRFTFVPMGVLHPVLPAIMELKPLLGLRSPLHTVARNLNPFDAKASLASVFHPNYRAVHRDAAKLMGMTELACFKGEGGEVERRPEKPCLVEGLRQGAAFEEEWLPTMAAGAVRDLEMDAHRLVRLWRGDVADAYAEATVIATAAVGLRLVGRAGSMADAETLAAELWAGRRRDAYGASKT
jgi:anthranilate phosphoribosyltransferase